MNQHISVVKAEYLEAYKVVIFFSDGTSGMVDFEKFLNDNPHPCWNKYKLITNFKKFRIEAGNLVWGKDWDLIFPVAALYHGDLSITCDTEIIMH
jgi:hypothetical protein